MRDCSLWLANEDARFDKFMEVSNNERPREALDSEVSGRSLSTLHAPLPRTTRHRLSILRRKKINSSQVVTGQTVGIKEVQDDIWLVSFIEYDLGYFDPETRVLEPLGNLSRPKSVTYVSGLDQVTMVGPWGLEPQTSTVSR
jgi:putative transposase